MAKTTRITGVNVSTVANFEGTFGAVLGLFVAIMHSLRGTIEVAESTQSVLSGLAFGMAAGVVSILVLPLVYFAIGWIIGLVHGWVFNIVSAGSGGIVVNTTNK